jgi:tetratricopeptide (TPR) repeat protein
MTMESCTAANPQLRRAERLCLLLAAVAAIWAAVSVARWVRRPTLLELGDRAVAAGNGSVAVEYYVAYLVDHPQDWQARGKLAAALRGLDPAQAVGEWRKIPAEAPEYPAAQRRIAEVCLVRQRYAEAKTALLALDAAVPDDWWAQLSLAEVFFRQRDFTLALHHAQRSATLRPEYPRTYFLIAELLDDLGRPAEMVGPLQKVIELVPDDYSAHLNLCYAYAKAGQAANTRKEAQWCLARQPQDVNARRLLATAARDEGHLDEAREELQKALQTAPDDLNCRLLEAEMLLFERKAAEAFQRLQPFYATYSTELRLVELLARAAAASGHPDAAEQYRQQVHALKKR